MSTRTLSRVLSELPAYRWPDPTRTALDIVPGDLPGTIHITRNGVTVSEIETEPERVAGMIELLKQHVPLRRTS